MSATKTKINLNLSSRYCDTWGPWEVAREFICNAIDADPDGYSVEYDKPCSQIIVRTSTRPSLAEMFIIGFGSKIIGGSTIGQFGEGSKVAALAARRSGQVEYRTATEKVEFEFIDSGIGHETLHAIISDHNDPSIIGMEVRVVMPGICGAAQGKFLDNPRENRVWQSNTGTNALYVKGVWIENIPELHFSWNLVNVSLNRDRSKIEGLNSCIARHFGLLNKDQMKELIASYRNSAEIAAMEYSWSHDSSVKSVAQSAFYELYGEKALLKTDSEIHNKEAERQGYIVQSLSSLAVTRFLQEKGVKTSASITLAQKQPERAEITASMQTKIDWLRKFDGLLSFSGAKICVAKSLNRGSYLGFADMEENTIWLSESLFSNGKDQSLVMTYLHEVAHIQSGEQDETREFEIALTEIIGTLAMEAISQ